MEEMVKVGVVLTPAEYRAFKVKLAREGKTATEVIRTYVRRYVKAQKRKGAKEKKK